MNVCKGIHMHIPPIFLAVERFGEFSAEKGKYTAQNSIPFAWEGIARIAFILNAEGFMCRRPIAMNQNCWSIALVIVFPCLSVRSFVRSVKSLFLNPSILSVDCIQWPINYGCSGVWSYEMANFSTEPVCERAGVSLCVCVPVCPMPPNGKEVIHLAFCINGDQLEPMLTFRSHRSNKRNLGRTSCSFLMSSNMKRSTHTYSFVPPVLLLLFFRSW